MVEAIYDKPESYNEIRELVTSDETIHGAFSCLSKVEWCGDKREHLSIITLGITRMRLIQTHHNASGMWYTSASRRSIVGLDLENLPAKVWHHKHDHFRLRVAPTWSRFDLYFWDAINARRAHDLIVAHFL
ncbi:MAG: hypothetical protein IT307_04370 [Chloroflexi bacterium]|nr:hypothetical protein [Chloroflexota bacterium]